MKQKFREQTEEQETRRKPSIFMLNPNRSHRFFDDIYADLIASLIVKYRVYRVYIPLGTLKYPSEDKPIAILVVDSVLVMQNMSVSLRWLKNMFK
jgi:hypothetical protein